MAGLAAAFGRGAMTNAWTDIANATCVIAWGANPSENHPACMAHVNKARNADRGALNLNTTKATLVVVDPRRTRTALQADDYIRIRPGTDIALINGLVREIISQMEGTTGAVDPAVQAKFFEYLNQTTSQAFFADGATAVNDESIVLNGTTATALVNANVAVGSLVVTSSDGTITYGSADYTFDYATHAVARTVASTIPDGATVLVDYSYGGAPTAGAIAGQSNYTDARFVVNSAGTDYARSRHVDGTKAFNNFPSKALSVTADANTVYNRLKAHVDAYDKATVANICGCSTGDVDRLVGYFIANSRCSSVAAATNVEQNPTVDGYKCLTMLYAMGITQHTYGSQNVKSFAVIQTLMGNMGRAGGGINALRGIHNVQGSTDMGLLYGNIPAYSANPTVQPSVDAKAFGKYMDALWGYPLSGSGTRANMDGSYTDSYTKANGWLQQQGFYNMTQRWFGDSTVASPTQVQMDNWYSLWPKGQGDDHISMFRAMGAGTTTAAVIWGQNPAVTEPNQGKIREGLYNLKVLVVADMFETETASCDRNGTGVTYFIPTAAHVEKAGSVTNSARTLQWRYEARRPVGNTREDTEWLLRLAKQLDVAGAFSHIQSANGWAAGDVYAKLYQLPYTSDDANAGGFDGLGDFNAVSGTAERANMLNAKDGTVYPPATAHYVTETVYGSEWVAERIFREMASPVGGTGTIWIYTGAYNAGATWTTDNKAGGQAVWDVHNRAKSRNNANDSNSNAFHGWGYSWLVNRRVLYNNGQVTGDVADFFMGPDRCARLFVSTYSAVTNYSTFYRKVHQLADKPSVVYLNQTTSPHYVGSVSYAGRFPAHTEPYESPRQDLVGTWGRNTKNTGEWDLVKSTTLVAGRDANVADYPYVLTSIRCVEHFQGGPITRNNWWNVELEPEPWIELNSADAAREGIRDGDYVKIITARNAAFGTGDPTTGTLGELDATYGRADYGKGFRARVGTGLLTGQRVAQGVVAIPWHWGDRGLSTGSRANDLCIDAGDANSTIPEYKACLCKIVKHDPTA